MVYGGTYGYVSTGFGMGYSSTPCPMMFQTQGYGDDRTKHVKEAYSSWPVGFGGLFEWDA